MGTTLTVRAKEYLDTLCRQIPNRRVGSRGNHQATDYFAQTIKSFGFDVECPRFDCIDWESKGATLSVEGRQFPAQVSPYSLGITASTTLVAASTTAELESLDITNKIVLLRDELTREQYLPKNFPFFQVDEQQRIIRLLENKKPAAIITATSRNPEMAGALYPFPVFEDGDFDIPSVFITEEEGAALAGCVGEEMALAIHATRIPAHGCNVIARKGIHAQERIVLFAHIDAKLGTPGALDNGTGIVTLLLLAELLENYAGSKCIELVALNGEDYFSNPGEQLYLKQNEDMFHEIALGINMDGLGYIKGRTAYSMYDCTSQIAELIENAFANTENFIMGEPWYQGDHALYLMNQRPALALTSERGHELMTEFVHTEKDTPEIIDPQKIVCTAAALATLVTRL